MADFTSVAITFIRHGESTDNLVHSLTFMAGESLTSLEQLPIWAGWRDAPLSEHGEFRGVSTRGYLPRYIGLNVSRLAVECTWLADIHPIASKGIGGIPLIYTLRCDPSVAS